MNGEIRNTEERMWMLGVSNQWAERVRGKRRGKEKRILSPYMKSWSCETELRNCIAHPTPTHGLAFYSFELSTCFSW